jgi:hypothetical protein
MSRSSQTGKSRATGLVSRPSDPPFPGGSGRCAVRRASEPQGPSLPAGPPELLLQLRADDARHAAESSRRHLGTARLAAWPMVYAFEAGARLPDCRSTGCSTGSPSRSSASASSLRWPRMSFGPRLWLCEQSSTTPTAPTPPSLSIDKPCRMPKATGSVSAASSPACSSLGPRPVRADRRRQP